MIPANAIKAKANLAPTKVKKQCAKCARVRAAAVSVASRIRDVIRGK